MFNIKSSIPLLFCLAVFFSFFKIQSQNFANQGEGKVIVHEFLSLDQSPDLSKPYQIATFYIKNFKILREEPEVTAVSQRGINLDSLGHSTPIYDKNGNEGGTVSSSMTVSVRKTKYLLDLKSKTAFIIGHKNGKTYYYKMEMKDFREDMYEFFAEISEFSDYKKIEFQNNNKVIAGNLCEEAVLVLNKKNSSKEPVNIGLWITKNKSLLKSPLDNMFNESSPFAVFSVSYPTEKGNGGFVGYYMAMVKDKKEEKIPDEKFEIPADAIQLTKEKWESYQFDF